ncbi:MAG: hypothetical protein Q9187_004206 [Circinaria calcarea]
MIPQGVGSCFFLAPASLGDLKATGGMCEDESKPLPKDYSLAHHDGLLVQNREHNELNRRRFYTSHKWLRVTLEFRKENDPDLVPPVRKKEKEKLNPIATIIPHLLIDLLSADHVVIQPVRLSPLHSHALPARSVQDPDLGGDQPINLLPPKAQPSPAAALAASQAFLTNRASNASLSAAAAAAALRSQTTSPVPVSQIQTKRMLQRQNSTSSHGSAGGNGKRPGGLSRQGSSGSMTERSFRDPSPNRPPSKRPTGDEPPPMPPLPKAYASPPPVPAKSDRRPASVEPVQRVNSPPPRLSAGRGVSLDRGPGVKAARPNRQSAIRNSSIPELVREDSKGSINFSRPMSPKTTPPTSPTSPVQDYHTNSTSAKLGSTTKPRAGPSTLSDSERDNLQYQIQNIANGPVKKKKKSTVPTITQGSHLAAGRSGARPTGSALDSTPNTARPSTSSTTSPSDLSPQSVVGTVDSPNVTTTRKKKNKRPVPVENTLEMLPGNEASDSDSVSERGALVERPRTYNTRAAGLLMKQPSIVREDREAEELEERGNANGRSIEATQNGDLNPKVSTTLNTAKNPPEKGSREQPRSRHVQASGITNLTPKPATVFKPVGSDEGSSDNTSRSHDDTLSPARATHFSSRPTYETSDGTKHEPPPRSISPAKSALKHSPLSRGASPAGFIPGGLAPSEASDTTSIVSDEGYRSLSKKKKNVRVSFDDDPTIVGSAASPSAGPDSPLLFSPQSKDGAKKGWFGLGKDKKKTQTPTEAEADDVIKPMPTLPSFGSVRGRQTENETREIPDKATNGGGLQSLNASNDHAIGGILAHDLATKANGATSLDSSRASAKIPLFPEASLAGNAKDFSNAQERNYENARSDLYQRDERGKPIAPGEGLPVDRETQDLESTHPPNQGDQVPSIAIQPATPGIEDPSRKSGEYWLGMPGGFPRSTEFLSQFRDEPGAIVPHHATDPTPSSIGIAEPEPDDVTPTNAVVSPIAGEVADILRQQTDVHHGDESDSTNDSIYSDAAEDLSDLEGDGFGSINAIVESPAVPPPLAVLPLFPSIQKADTRQPGDEKTVDVAEPPPEDGWDKAQAYWSGLSQSRKQQIEKDASKEPSHGPDVTPDIEPVTKPKKKKATRKDLQTDQSQSSVPNGQVFQESIERTSSPAQPLKKSMRDAPSPVSTSEPPRLRSSMRGGVPPKPAIRESTLRNTKASSGSPEPKGALQKKQRPMSAVAMVDYGISNSKPANQYTNTSTANHSRPFSDSAGFKSLTPIPTQPPTKSSSQSTKKPTNQSSTKTSTQPSKSLPIKSNLRRNVSNGSDSSSSFKKARPSTSDNNRYTMRRSMRSASVDERPKSAYANQSSGFSLRSVSPSESTARRPFSSAGPGMRTSLRASADFGATRSSKSPTRSLGFGKGSKPKAAPTKSSRFSSRFGDSSDEDGGAQPYDSRFADSSDEDGPAKLPANLTPIRGIPKRVDEGDSTDLEDSDDDVPRRANTAKVASPKSSKLEGAALASGSLRNTEPSNAGGGLQIENAVGKDKKKRSLFGGLGRKREDPKIVKSDPEFDAHRNALLAHSKAEKNMGTLASVPESPVVQSPKSPKSPKLQRRNTPQRFQSDSWPLPQSPITPTSNGRPTTSDGVVRDTNSRPELGVRTATVQSQSNGVVLGKKGKKKRFPLLRKAFGLHD